MNILHIDSSILGDYSVSRQVSAAVTKRIQDSIPDAIHTYRDIAANPIPHLSGAYLAAMQNPDAEQSPTVQSDIAQSAEVLAEFLAADIVVIGAGLYNFGIPSQLKAWIDRILVAGKTFRYTAEGKPEGLVGKKRIMLAIARGGVYSGESPIASFEHTETYLRTAFGFIGLEAEVVVAEGVSIGPDQRATAIKNAETQIAAIAF